jgi:hypothetical protein
VVVVVVVVVGEETVDVLLLELAVVEEPFEQGFQTVTTQPAADPVEDPPELPLDVVEVVLVDVVVLAVLALAGKIQSGPVLPFALHEALSPMMSRYSAAWATNAADSI